MATRRTPQGGRAGDPVATRSSATSVPVPVAPSGRVRPRRPRRGRGSPTGWRSWWSSSRCWSSPTPPRCAPTCSSARTSTTCAPRSPARRRTSRRWSARSGAGADDEYVKAQARERFGWVMPGETSYQVIDRNGKPLEQGDELTDPNSVARTGAGPLVEQGLRHRRGGRPPEEGADAGDADHAPPTPTPRLTSDAPSDPGRLAIVAAQLGRPPRSIHAVAHRCPCGNPDVVATEPRLDDGTPFPTTFYLTCPRAASMIGTLEASGLMREMTERLGEDDELAAAYRPAHEAYLEARAAIGEVPEIAGVSAGGMPDRVKCLHVLAGQSLAQGRGREPARRRGARRAGGLVEVRPLRRSQRGGEPHDPRRRLRLRHQLAAAADRRPRRRRRHEHGPGPRAAHRAARPGRRPHRPDRRCLAAAGVRAPSRSTWRPCSSTTSARSGSARPPPPATPRTPRSSCAGVRERVGRRRPRSRRSRGGAGQLRRRHPRPAAAARADAGRRHRRRLDRADPRPRRRHHRGARLPRHRLGAAQRAPPRQRSSLEGGDRGRGRPTSTPRSTPARSTRPTPAP